MSARTELDRLAAARPPILDHTQGIVSPSAEDEILQQILSTTRVTSSRRRRAAARGRQAQRPVIALAAAAAVIAVAGGGALVRSALAHPSAPSRPKPGQRILHVVARGLPTLGDLAERAVDAACRTDILYVRTVYAAGTTEGGVAVMATWTKGISDREKLFSAGGAILNDESAVITHRMRVRRFVDYTSRTWQTDSIASRQYGSGGPAGQRVAQFLAPQSLDRVRRTGQDTPSRTITVVTVHGVRMIVLTFSYPRPLPTVTGPIRGPGLAPLLGSTELLPAAAGRNDSVLAYQVWLRATGFLPVRAVFTGAGGRVLGTETFAWLSPTAANRAILSPAPVPAGFRLTSELAH